MTARKGNLDWLPAEFRPKTPKAQWQNVNNWRKRLESSEVDNYPILSALRDAWESLGRDQEGDDRLPIDRTADTPLAALFYFVEVGLYPPPELLLALSEVWHSYLNGAGHVSLEQAFLGNPRPKAGNYAKRKQTLIRKMIMALDMTKFIRAGLTRMEAAERIAADWERRGEVIDPETIVRTIPPFKIARKSDE